MFVLAGRSPWRPRSQALESTCLEAQGIVFKAAFWTTHKAPHQNESILRRRQQASGKEARAQGEKPEPTAIEFQDAFREIMAAAQTPKRRLVIVVDNLDRLPPKEAMNIWATVRSFFLGADGGIRKLDRASLPTVIMRSTRRRSLAFTADPKIPSSLARLSRRH